jgi:hypothetical protein
MSTLAQFSVGYVARSFSSDPAASKALLEKVFDPERLEKYAHTEVPALCHEISGIAAYDPGFAAWIYGRVFGYRVDSERETRMTPSHIMPMTSNESQDYDLARYGLAQYFPTLLAENPAAATEAVIGAVEGEIVVREHLTRTSIDQPFTVDGKQLMLREDGSAVWAWDRNNTHPDGFGMILGRFVAYLREANSTDLTPVVNTLFEKNSVALLWARLLMVGAERPDTLADKLWGLATNERIMLSSNVGHDAIEAVAAFYPSRSPEERRTFELAAFDFGAEDPIHPSIREEWLATLFQAIGLEQLATEEAREFLSSEKGSKPSPNARFEIISSRMEMTQRQILSEAGVLVDEPANDGLLTLVEAVKTQVGLVHAGNSLLEDIPGAIEQLVPLHAAIQEAEAQNADNDVLCTAEDMAGDLCTAIFGTAGRKKLEIATEHLLTLQRIAVALSLSTRQRYGRAPRTCIIPALYSLCQYSETEVEPLQRLETLATDINEAVRCAVARNLVTLNGYAADKMWGIAEKFVASEHHPVVIQNFVASFLSNIRSVNAERAESMLFTVHKSFPFAPPPGDNGRRNELDDTIAYLFSLLYIWHVREASGQEMLLWAADPLVHEEQIRCSLWIAREAASGGYDDDSKEAREPRERLQGIIWAVVDKAAAELEAHFRLNNVTQNGNQQDAKTYAKCLEYACATYFFGTGAFPEQNAIHVSPIRTNAGKRRFLADTEVTLRRIGDIAVPHTMHELVQLFDFLLDGNPELSFDLFGHALTTSGCKQGFQLESLGTDVLVRIVSRCLADYEYIFRDERRRKLLIECIDIFVEAGWPAALRLLYRLPDALR